MFNTKQFDLDVREFNKKLNDQVLEIENLIAVTTDYCQADGAPREDVEVLTSKAQQLQQKLNLYKQHKENWSVLMSKNGSQSPLSQDEQILMANAAVNAKATLQELMALRRILNTSLLQSGNKVPENGP